jgi:NTP pyrophosphatase (non-canonical NTP hydrolase)
MVAAARHTDAVDTIQPMLAGLDALPTKAGPHRRKDLTVREIASWARRQVTRIARTTHSDRSGELFAYRQAAKLVEEVGELHAEMLGRSKVQRSSKTQEFDQTSLENELADVLLATTLLAEILGVDVASAVRAKMEIIDARNKP